MEKIKELFDAIEQFRSIDRNTDFFSDTKSFTVVGYTFRPMFQVAKSLFKPDNSVTYIIRFEPTFRVFSSATGTASPSTDWEEWFDTIQEFSDFISHPGFLRVEELNFTRPMGRVVDIELKDTLYGKFLDQKCELLVKHGMMSEEVRRGLTAALGTTLNR